MTTRKEQIIQDVELIGNVLFVRAEAIEAGFIHLDAPLYEAAKAEDDAAIVSCLDKVIEDVSKRLDEYEAKLKVSASLIEHMFVIAESSMVKGQVDELKNLRTHAAENVALITSGEVCYPPANRSTVELMAAMRQLSEELAGLSEDATGEADAETSHS